jgi:hypothetical protein
MIFDFCIGSPIGLFPDVGNSKMAVTSGNRLRTKENAKYGRLGDVGCGF